MPTNEDYMAAADKPNIGAKPSDGLMQKTRDVAIGKRGARAKVAISGSAVRPRNNVGPKGSLEGYMHSAPAHLHANGSGYDRNPKARGFKPATNLQKYANTPGFGGTRFSMGMSNLSQRSMSQTSSMSRLSNLMKLNKLF